MGVAKRRTSANNARRSAQTLPALNTVRKSPPPTLRIGPAEPALYVFNFRALPKKRPRAMQGKAKRIFTYTPAETRQYEQMITQYAAMQHSYGQPFESDLVVWCSFFFNDRHHGDIDNLTKSILDGMQGVVFKNDRQIKALHAELFFKEEAEQDELEDWRERTEVVVTRRMPRQWWHQQAKREDTSREYSETTPLD